MATVESTVLDLKPNGKHGRFKVVFTDASDSSIMAPGTGLTLTGTVNGAKTASITKWPRVEIRNSKTVVEGEFLLDDGEFFPWAGNSHEVVTATASAGGLFSAEVGATESAAFTDLAVTNRSFVDESGNPRTNLRRTRFKAGAVPTGFAVAPVLTFDADAETHTDGDTVAITDQVSGLTTKFRNSRTSSNAYIWRANRYGTGRHAIDLNTIADTIQNVDAVTQSSGYTLHLTMELLPDAGSIGQSRFGHVCNVTNGVGIDIDGVERVFVRLPVSTTANSTRDRDGLNYKPAIGTIVTHTFVFESNGDVRHWCNGRSYIGFQSAALSGSTFTLRDLIRRNSGAGSIFVRRFDLIEGALTDAQVVADHDYYANVIFADDEDLNGSLACFLSSAGTTGGTGRFNDPISVFDASAAQFAGGIGAWNGNATANTKDYCFLGLAGDVIDVVPHTTSFTPGSTNQDPVNPCHFGTYGTVSSSDPIAIFDYVDQGSDADRTVINLSANAANEFALISTEWTSTNRTYRAGGTATVADSEEVEVTLIGQGTTHVGLSIVNCPISQISHVVEDTTTGSLTAQTWSLRDTAYWRMPVRNIYTKDSSIGSGGTEEASTFFHSKRENIWRYENIAYEPGWDPDVLGSTEVTIPNGGGDTFQWALDNIYSHWNYGSLEYGYNVTENLACIRTAGNDVQYRNGGMTSKCVSWESVSGTFISDNDSLLEDFYIEGQRAVLGGNQRGYRGGLFSSSGVGDAPRLAIIRNILMNLGTVPGGVPGAGIGIGNGRSSADANAPTGLAVIRAENLTVFSARTGFTFQNSNGGASGTGYIRRFLIDMDNKSDRFVFDNGQLFDGVNFYTPDISDLTIELGAVDRGSIDIDAAYEDNVTASNLADWVTATGVTSSNILDRTTEGLGFTRRTLTQWCQTVHSFTKVDVGQTDAEEFGEQWYEAFADAVREGGDPSPYFASAAYDWVLAGWAPDTDTKAAIETADPGEYWGAYDYLSGTPSGPLTITNSDGTTISQPVSATAQPNTDVRFVVRLNAVGQNLTGLAYTESGVLRLETDILPLTLTDGTSATFAVLLRSATLGANQTGSLTITANGGLSATVDYLLTVASPWSIRRSDGSAIPANPITGTFQQSAGSAVFQVRIDANADTLENFSYTTDGIVTLPTGSVELGPLSPGESKILNIFLDTATLGAGQTGYAEIDFDANGVAVTTIRMEFDIEVIAAVLEANRARSRSRIR